MATKIFLSEALVLAALQPCVRYPRDFGVRFEELSHLEPVGAVALHANRQRFDASNGQEGVEGGHGRAQVSEPHGVTVESIRKVPCMCVCVCVCVCVCKYIYIYI